MSRNSGLSFLVSVIFGLAFLFVANTIFAYSSTQEVYVIEEPPFKLIARLESLGRSAEEINNYIKKIRITNETAKEKFDITLVDNDLRSNYLYEQLKAVHSQLKGKGKVTWPAVYPAVAIAYMGQQVGYGLFALEDIRQGTVIAEYTGKHIKEKGVTPPDSYDAMAYVEGKNSYEKVAALHEGNVARFAQHLLTKEHLKLYKYKFYFEAVAQNVVLANAGLVLLANDEERHVILMATTDIKKHQQIGFFYYSGIKNLIVIWLYYHTVSLKIITTF